MLLPSVKVKCWLSFSCFLSSSTNANWGRLFSQSKQCLCASQLLSRSLSPSCLSFDCCSLPLTNPLVASSSDDFLSFFIPSLFACTTWGSLCVRVIVNTSTCTNSLVSPQFDGVLFNWSSIGPPTLQLCICRSDFACQIVECYWFFGFHLHITHFAWRLVEWRQFLVAFSRIVCIIRLGLSILLARSLPLNWLCPILDLLPSWMATTAECAPGSVHCLELIWLNSIPFSLCVCVVPSFLCYGYPEEREKKIDFCFLAPVPSHSPVPVVSFCIIIALVLFL